MSNYPPGVTGNEPQIAGYDEDEIEVDDWTCDQCDHHADMITGYQIRASRETYIRLVDCPACGAVDESEHEYEDDRDPDIDRADMWED